VSPVSNYTIPISTPFILTGAATDPEGDTLTYQWEQNDNATTSGANSVAAPTKATGPNWLSFVPTSSPSRMFPRLSTVQAGLAVTPPLAGGDAGTNIEALSSVSRILNFRLTVRDNRPYVVGSTIGQTQFTDMAVTVSNTSGPFKVTAPNSAVSWTGGTTQSVTWDVAGTTGAPVSTANVKISLSTDGGATFPTVLAASTANDGSENITVPNVTTTTARIKIEAVGNIYFDMSDVNFSITGGPVGQRAVLDFDGDNKTDYAVIRDVGGTQNWYLQRSTAGFIGQPWGATGDQFVPADYDGDLKWDIGVWRAGTFYILKSSDGTLQTVAFGAGGDDARITQDFDGDGKADPAVTRNVGGSLTWYILRSTAGFTSVPFGNATTDVSVRGDFDGDNKADVAIYRNSTGSPSNTFYVLRSSDGGVQGQAFGNFNTDYITPGDFDGDNKTDYAVWRGVGAGTPGTWYWLDSSTNAFHALNFGAGGAFGVGDQPVMGDYDGDAKTDQAVWRPGTGTFYVNRSTAGFIGVAFGASGDAPPAFTLQAR
jgi:hypothetical protein